MLQSSDKSSRPIESTAARGRWLIPGGLLQGPAEELADLFFQSAMVANAFLAFARLLRAEGFGGALACDEAGPAVIGTVEPGRFGFASATRFAAGAPGGGEAARQEREGDVEGALFLWHLS